MSETVPLISKLPLSAIAKSSDFKPHSYYVELPMFIFHMLMKMPGTRYFLLQEQCRSLLKSTGGCGSGERQFNRWIQGQFMVSSAGTRTRDWKVKNQTYSAHLHTIPCFCFSLCKCSIFPLPGWLLLLFPAHGRLRPPHQPPSCKALPIHVFTEDLESLCPKSIFIGKWTDWSVGIRCPLWVQWTQDVDQHGGQISEK